LLLELDCFTELLLDVAELDEDFAELLDVAELDENAFELLLDFAELLLDVAELEEDFTEFDEDESSSTDATTFTLPDTAIVFP